MPLPRSLSSRELFDRFPTKVTKVGVELLEIASSASKQISFCVTVLPPGEVSNVIQGVFESMTVSGVPLEGRGSFYGSIEFLLCVLLPF